MSLIAVHMLSMLVKQVKDEQAYIVMREQMHRNTAESTNGRVKWWSIFQMAVLVAEGIFQVWWLKRFFEVRRPLHAQSSFTNQGFCAYTGEASCLKEKLHFQDIRFKSLSLSISDIENANITDILHQLCKAKRSGYKMVHQLACVPSSTKMPPWLWTPRLCGKLI